MSGITWYKIGCPAGWCGLVQRNELYGGANLILSPRSNALKAGISYFTIIFAIGFIFGVIRVIALSPYLSETLAVVIELPFILAMSWSVCSRLILKLQVSSTWTPRILMGSLAFGLLMAAEIALSVFGFDRTIAEHFQNYWRLEGMLGLIGQLLFALFPVIQRQPSAGRATGN
jgi:hypothetical protein